MNEEKLKYLTNAERRLAKAKELEEKGFTSKSAQKDCLFYISYAFEDINRVLGLQILSDESLQQEEQDNLYFNRPTYPYQLKDKHLEIYKKYDMIQKLKDIKDYSDKIKSMEIVKKNETKIEKKEKTYSEKLQKKDRSNILNNDEYNKGIKKIIVSAKNTLEPIYENTINDLISYLNMSKEQIIEKGKNNEEFKKFYLSNIKGQTEESIRKKYNELLELELLDIKYKAMSVINFDIKSVKVLSMQSNYKSWVINDNKKFEIKVILAGGYNIQCLHHRVLVKLTNY